MGRTGYDLAEEARASRLAHIHQPPAPQSLDRAAGQSPMARGRAARNGPGPVAEGVEDPHVELSRFSVAASVESCDVYGAPAPMLISRYERNPPPEFVEGKPGQPTGMPCCCCCCCWRLKCWLTACIMATLLEQAVTIWPTMAATQNSSKHTTSGPIRMLAVSEMPGLVGIAYLSIAAGPVTFPISRSA